MTTDRLTPRLALLVVSEATFLYYARQYRTLRKHRGKLREMARQYPLMIDFREVRVTCESPEDVDRLTSDLRAKLVRAWVSAGTETGDQRQ